jgi:hypothetical protein
MDPSKTGMDSIRKFEVGRWIYAPVLFTVSMTLAVVTGWVTKFPRLYTYEKLSPNNIATLLSIGGRFIDAMVGITIFSVCTRIVQHRLVRGMSTTEYSKWFTIATRISMLDLLLTKDGLWVVPLCGLIVILVIAPSTGMIQTFTPKLTFVTRAGTSLVYNIPNDPSLNLTDYITIMAPVDQNLIAQAIYAGMNQTVLDMFGLRYMTASGGFDPTFATSYYGNQWCMQDLCNNNRTTAKAIIGSQTMYYWYGIGSRYLPGGVNYTTQKMGEWPIGIMNYTSACGTPVSSEPLVYFGSAGTLSACTTDRNTTIWTIAVYNTSLYGTMDASFSGRLELEGEIRQVVQGVKVYLSDFYVVPLDKPPIGDTELLPTTLIGPLINGMLLTFSFLGGQSGLWGPLGSMLLSAKSTGDLHDWLDSGIGATAAQWRYNSHIFDTGAYPVISDHILLAQTYEIGGSAIGWFWMTVFALIALGSAVTMLVGTAPSNVVEVFHPVNMTMVGMGSPRIIYPGACRGDGLYSTHEGVTIRYRNLDDDHLGLVSEGGDNLDPKGKYG